MLKIATLIVGLFALVALVAVALPLSPSQADLVTDTIEDVSPAQGEDQDAVASLVCRLRKKTSGDPYCQCASTRTGYRRWRDYPMFFCRLRSVVTEKDAWLLIGMTYPKEEAITYS